MSHLVSLFRIHGELPDLLFIYFDGSHNTLVVLVRVILMPSDDS